MERHAEVLDRTYGIDPANPSMAMQYFGAAAQEYSKRYGVSPDLFAKISVKSRKHAANNPYAVFREPVTEQEVLESKALYGGLTRLQACPPTCGAGAAIVCSEDFARAHGLTPGVAIAAQELVTDFPSVFTDDDVFKVVGADITRVASQRIYEKAGVDPRDIQVVELHDCFSVNEVLSYEALGLVDEGCSEKFILDGDNTYGGRVVVNPSGGLLSKGHPLGATRLGAVCGTGVAVARHRRRTTGRRSKACTAAQSRSRRRRRHHALRKGCLATTSANTSTPPRRSSARRTKGNIMGQLDGRVAIVTGAGAGLGREHALLMAAEGASIVVNDLRGAQQVADEIVAAGGSAIAVEGSIAEMAVGEKLTDAAVSTFGNLHSVVNNAGIIRDAMLWNMTEEEFDSVIAVHLKGTFSATRAAVRYWRDQSKAGVQETRNLVNTSSGSGLHGNYGQWNYSAAKARSGHPGSQRRSRIRAIRRQGQCHRSRGAHRTCQSHARHQGFGR